MNELRDALARAMYGHPNEHLDSAQIASDGILRSLHADPEVLTAIEDALIAWDGRGWNLQPCDVLAGLLADALLGAS